MKKNTLRILSLICVCACVLSLCSAFAFAAQPEDTEEVESVVRASSRWVTTTRTYLYNAASTSSGYVFNGNVPVGSLVEVKSTTGAFYYADVTIYEGAFVGTYTGYILKSHVS